MADDFQEKSEEPTPKKLADARKKGQVARSQDMTSGLMLLAGMMILYFFSDHFFTKIQMFTVAVFQNLTYPYGSIDTITYGFREGVMAAVLLLAPMLGGMFVMAFASSALQVGFNFSTDPLKPKWKSVNIFDPSNYKKYFSSTTLMRTFLGVGKMMAVSVICFFLIRGWLSEAILLIHGTTQQIFVFVAWHAFHVAMTITIFLLVLGVLDFVFQKWKFTHDLKMSKQEVKDERKQTEGDTHVKSKMRSMMQAFTRNRMKENVPQSDVIVANPIHFAVALKYDDENMAAPVCVAKGARRMAILIKELAKDSGVPIVVNPPLAQALYKTVEVGAPVPAALYHGVAEVLAYVYRLNEQMGAAEQGLTKKSPRK